MKLSSLIALPSLLGLLALGCGDEEPDDIYSSGLDDTKAASDLDDDEKHTYCQRLDAHVNVRVGFEEIARLTCLPGALLASTRKDCEAALDTCMKNAPPPITINVRADRERACFDSLDRCEADIGTLESCVNVNVGSVRQLLETITCNRVGDTTVDEDITRAMQTAGACAKASASCEGATDILI